VRGTKDSFGAEMKMFGSLKGGVGRVVSWAANASIRKKLLQPAPIEEELRFHVYMFICVKGCKKIG